MSFVFLYCRTFFLSHFFYLFCFTNLLKKKKKKKKKGKKKKKTKNEKKRKNLPFLFFFLIFFTSWLFSFLINFDDFTLLLIEFYIIKMQKSHLNIRLRVPFLFIGFVKHFLCNF